jgi:hypothetical protein
MIILVECSTAQPPGGAGWSRWSKPPHQTPTTTPPLLGVVVVVVVVGELR